MEGSPPLVQQKGKRTYAESYRIPEKKRMAESSALALKAIGLALGAAFQPGMESSVAITQQHTDAIRRPLPDGLCHTVEIPSRPLLDWQILHIVSSSKIHEISYYTKSREQ